MDPLVFGSLKQEPPDLAFDVQHTSDKVADSTCDTMPFDMFSKGFEEGGDVKFAEVKNESHIQTSKGDPPNVEQQNETKQNLLKIEVEDPLHRVPAAASFHGLQSNGSDVEMEEEEAVSPGENEDEPEESRASSKRTRTTFALYDDIYDKLYEYLSLGEKVGRWAKIKNANERKAYRKMKSGAYALVKRGNPVTGRKQMLIVERRTQKIVPRFSELQHICQFFEKRHNLKGSRRLARKISKHYVGLGEKIVRRTMYPDGQSSLVPLKTKLTRVKQRLQIEIEKHAKFVMEKVQIEVVDFSDVPAKLDGKTYKFVLSVLEVHSRFCWLRPLCDHSAKLLVKALYGIFVEHGAPYVLLCEQGKRFQDVVASLNQQLGVKMVRQAPEREENELIIWQEQLKSNLTKTAKEKSSTWVRELMTYSREYNTSPHNCFDGELSPFEVYFGRTPWNSVESYEYDDQFEFVEESSEMESETEASEEEEVDSNEDFEPNEDSYTAQVNDAPVTEVHPIGHVESPDRRDREDKKKEGHKKETAAKTLADKGAGQHKTSKSHRGRTGADKVAPPDMKKANPDEKKPGDPDLYRTYRPFKCQYCGHAFARIGLCRTHERIHTGERPYSCKTCGRAFVSISNQRAHEKVHTRGDEKFPCVICGKVYNCVKNLKYHLRNHSDVEAKKHVCQDCGKSFSLKSHLMGHLRTHTGERPFECKLCHKNYIEKASLVRHEKTHSESGKFPCVKCDKSFNRWPHLLRHEETVHAGEKSSSKVTDVDKNEIVEKSRKSDSDKTGVKRSKSSKSDKSVEKRSKASKDDRANTGTGKKTENEKKIKKEKQPGAKSEKTGAQMVGAKSEKTGALSLGAKSEKTGAHILKVPNPRADKKVAESLFDYNAGKSPVFSSPERNPVFPGMLDTEKITADKGSDFTAVRNPDLTSATLNAAAKDFENSACFENIFAIMQSHFSGDGKAANLATFGNMPDFTETEKGAKFAEFGKNPDFAAVGKSEKFADPGFVQNQVPVTAVSGQKSTLSQNPKSTSSTKPTPAVSDAIQNELQTLLRQGMEDNPFKCDMCWKTFPTKQKLWAHRRSHTEDKPFRCRYCGKPFRREGNFKKHEEACMHTETPYKCQYCEKSFSLESYLKEHELLHTSVTPYQCNECDKAFTKKELLFHHKKNVHVCRNRYQCRFCEKFFPTTYGRMRHECTHTGIKPFQCQFCEKAFIRKQHMMVHERIHTGDTPFICSECGKTFRSKTHLQRHKLTHSLEKPFQCLLCPKRFVRKSHLQQHQHTHWRKGEAKKEGGAVKKELFENLESGGARKGEGLFKSLEAGGALKLGDSSESCGTSGEKSSFENMEIGENLESGENLETGGAPKLDESFESTESDDSKDSFERLLETESDEDLTDSESEAGVGEHSARSGSEADALPGSKHSPRSGSESKKSPKGEMVVMPFKALKSDDNTE